MEQPDRPQRPTLLTIGVARKNLQRRPAHRRVDYAGPPMRVLGAGCLVSCVALAMSGCSSSAVHGSVGDDPFGPSFATTVFTSESGSDPTWAEVVAVTGDVGCRVGAEYLPPSSWNLSLVAAGVISAGGGSVFSEDQYTDGFSFSLRHEKGPGSDEESDPLDEFYAIEGSMEVVEFEQEGRLRVRGSVELVEFKPGESDETHDHVSFDLDAVWCDVAQDD